MSFRFQKRRQLQFQLVLTGNKMDTSVIIVNWNTRDILRDCLVSVYAQTKAVSFEVIVIDNASTDGSAEMVRAEFPEVILLQNDKNRGFAAANNQGMSVAKGRYVLLLNSDTIILDDAVSGIVRFADSQPQAAVVGCRVLNPDKTLQPTCFMFPSLLNMLLSSTYLYKIFPRNRFFGRERMTWWNRNDVREVDVTTGCFMLVRQEAIERVGMMDELFFMYGEETDWCYRLKKAGWKIMFTPVWQIIHLGGQSSKKMKPEMAMQLRASILLFFKKHMGRISYCFACLLVALFFLVRLPLWFLKALAVPRTWRASLLCAGTYFTAFWRALLGWEYLAYHKRNPVKFKGICCFGGEDWWYHNRGHIDMQLMRNYAKSDKVLYINSIVMQKPKLTQGKKFLYKFVRKAKSIFRGVRKQGENFWVYSPVSLPLHHIGWASQLNRMLLKGQVVSVLRLLGMCNPVVWVACPAACETALRMKKAKLVYQRTDRYEEYPNVDVEAIRECDRRLKKCADLTIFVNRRLYEEEANQCRKAIYLDHGVDYDMFAKAENDKEKPFDIEEVGRPTAGFFGGIDDHTSDIGFIEQVTDLLPDINFVFVGKASADISRLVLKKNVWMLGQKPYEQIPHYGKCFDVAFMPWRQGRWIEACNPIKLKEYLSLGKPIISTPFPELAYYRDVTYEAATPQEFADCIKQALAENSSERILARRERVANATWESKAKSAMQALFETESAEIGT
jgi:GT2 family glycosyltransferase/glycosyltransferase involved in cell wall biosynthesis